jgi:hypothetical protein
MIRIFRWLSGMRIPALIDNYIFLSQKMLHLFTFNKSLEVGFRFLAGKADFEDVWFDEALKAK